MIIDEKTYCTNLDIKYYFEKSNYDSDYLVVVFSGFNRRDAKIQKQYNYIRALSNINCHKLYILDSYGPRGCYYIGHNMNFEVETAVISCITSIASKYDIPNRNIITLGSSKGGSAALYYGLKYNFGNIVSGAPQTKIADYVINVAPETADYMLGSKNNDKYLENIEKCNNLIFKQINKDKETKIYLFSSENDWQYKEHIIPLIKEIELNKINSDICIDNNMKNHSDIAIFFPDFLKRKIIEIVCGVNIKINSIDLENNKVIIDKDIEFFDNYKGCNISVLFKGAEKTSEYEYSLLDKNDIKIDKPDNYSVLIRINENKKNGLLYEEKIDQKILGGESFNYFGNKISYEDNRLKFYHKIDEFEKIKYAYYVLKDDIVIEKNWYCNKDYFEYNTLEKGRYRIMYFILTQANEKVIGKSDEITI